MTDSRKALVLFPETLRVEVMTWQSATRKFSGKETKGDKLVRKIVTDEDVIVIDFMYYMLHPSDKLRNHLPADAMKFVLRGIAGYVPKTNSGGLKPKQPTNKKQKTRRYTISS